MFANQSFSKKNALEVTDRNKQESIMSTTMV